MTAAALALIPALSALFFAALLLLVRRRAAGARGAWAFQLFLGAMVGWSASAVVWRLASDRFGADSAITDSALRLVIFFGMGVAPAVLAFASARHTSRWSRRGLWFAALTAAAVAVGTLSGAMGRFVVGDAGALGTWDLVAALGSMVAVDLAYVAALGHLVYAYRQQSDPFERNRVKYVGIAVVVAGVAGHTNMIPALQRVPVDQAMNAAAASLLVVSLVRYRLFDADIALRRGLVQAVAGMAVTPLYVGLVLLFHSTSEQALLSPAGVVVMLAAGIPMAFIGALTRRQMQRAVDRVFVGRRLERRTALAAFTRRTMEVRGVSELIRDACDICQGALESGFAAVLIADRDSPDGAGSLRLADVSGPFPRPQREWTIRTDNAVLRAIVDADEVATPLWLSETAAAGAISSADRADFAPWSDCLIAPVVARGTLVGVIAIGPPVYSEPYTLEDLDLLRNVAGQMALAVENARLFEQVEAQAFTDYLTALPNHRALQEQFSEKLDAAAERGAPLSVVMVDIDNFKLLNDVYGHQVGDDALRRIASLLRLSLRTEDMVGRYGGDEFLFVLPNRARSEAEAVMERIARRVEAVPLSPPSVGLAAARAHPRAHQLGGGQLPGGWRDAQSTDLGRRLGHVAAALSHPPLRAHGREPARRARHARR